MRLGWQEVKLLDVITNAVGPTVRPVLLVEGHLDPWTQAPFMVVAESGYDWLDGCEVYIADAWKIFEAGDEVVYHYDLVTRDNVRPGGIVDESSEEDER